MVTDNIPLLEQPVLAKRTSFDSSLEWQDVAVSWRTTQRSNLTVPTCVLAYNKINPAYTLKCMYTRTLTNGRGLFKEVQTPLTGRVGSHNFGYKQLINEVIIQCSSCS